MKNFATFSIIFLLLNSCISYPGKYESYQNLTYPKAMAKEIYPNGSTGNAWGIASSYSVDDARNKAIRNCISYSRSKMCVIQMENDFNVLDLEIAQFKSDNPWIPQTPRQQPNQQIDWGRVAGVIGKDILDREEARTKPSPSSTKSCLYVCPMNDNVIKEQFMCDLQITVDGEVCYWKRYQ